MSRRQQTDISILFALVALWHASGAPAIAQQVSLITTDGASREVQLLAVQGQTLEVRNSTGITSAIPLNRCIGWTRLNQIETPEEPVVTVTFDDGQRLVGPAGAIVAEADSLRFQHPDFGAVRLLPDHMRSLQLQPEIEIPKAGRGDVIVLANGDRLEGIIGSLGSNITLEPLDAAPGQTVSIPFDRVGAISLLTPPRPSTLPRVWLDDGTVVDIQQITLGDDGLYRLRGVSLVQSEQSLLLDSGAVVGLLFYPPGMMPLASTPIAAVQAPAYRLSVPEPKSNASLAPLGVEPITIVGPLRVEYRMPSGWTEALLIADALLPEDSRQYADFDVIIRSDGAPPATLHFDRSSPSGQIRAAVSGPKFSIEITEGRFGPVQDRLVLSQAMLLSIQHP